MKAICVTADRALEVRDIPTPGVPAPGHLLIEMEASAINHGDKAFLKMPAAGNPLTLGQYDVWGASGSGRVIAVGAGAPRHYADKQVAVYRSLGRSAESIGLWSERAQVPFTACLVLPEYVRARDYCGSLVNVMTAYAYLEEITAAGHGGVIVTAGSSATGHALACLARTKGIPAIFLVRTVEAGEALRLTGVEHVIVIEEGFTNELEPLAVELGATAVFDGVGGDLIGSIASSLPLNSTIHCYGLLGGAAPLAVPSALFVMRNLTIRRFSNFESPTVRDHERLMQALKTLEGLIDDRMFATRLGRQFRLDQIGIAIEYEPLDGTKAVLSV